MSRTTSEKLVDQIGRVPGTVPAPAPIAGAGVPSMDRMAMFDRSAVSATTGAAILGAVASERDVLTQYQEAEEAITRLINQYTAAHRKIMSTTLTTAGSPILELEARRTLCNKLLVELQAKAKLPIASRPSVAKVQEDFLSALKAHERAIMDSSFSLVTLKMKFADLTAVAITPVGERKYSDLKL